MHKIDFSGIRTDIFVRVIDNFGDAGIAWRLAKDLAGRGSSVRLIIDDPSPLSFMTDNLRTGNIRVIQWDIFSESGNFSLPNLIIEMFACRLPENYLQACISSPIAPKFVNYDYFSAEDWVDRFNGLDSIHPRYRTKKTNFFPGISPRSTPFIIEEDYAERKKSFDRAQFRKNAGADGFVIFFFAYPFFPTSALSKSVNRTKRHCTLLLAKGEASRHLASVIVNPLVNVVELPYFRQETLDEILWASDVNIVRGEDSAQRAMLAGKPFLWNIYHTPDNAHEAKISAFTDKAREYMGSSPELGLWKKAVLSVNKKDCCPEILSRFLEASSGMSPSFEKFSLLMASRGTFAGRLAQILKNR